MKTIMWKYSLGSTDDVWVEERKKEGKKEQSQTKIPYLNSPPKIGGIRAQRTVRGLCTDLINYQQKVDAKTLSQVFLGNETDIFKERTFAVQRSSIKYYSGLFTTS